MAENNYYDSSSVNMKYLEIGIALDPIDRMNPGLVPFCIPVLTPNSSKNTSTSTKIIQKSKTNIFTENKDAVDVSNIEIGNTIYIEIPKELTSLPGAIYDVKGTLDIVGDGSININTSHMEGTGTVSELLGKIDVSGSTQGNMQITIHNTTVTGTLDLTLNDSNRYIPANSRWLISFIGGDMSMPCVVCRLPDA